MTATGKCRLCLRRLPLIKSHIVPEFLYRPLYNERHGMMGINSVGGRGWRLVRCGLYQRLLCEDCEHFLNVTYEQPFREAWIVHNQLPEVFEFGKVYSPRYDYCAFKLFHMSVLFRAPVSTLRDYEEVKLGPHEERLRQMVLNQDPKGPTVYPILGVAVVHHERRTIVPVMVKPDTTRMDECNGFRVVTMMFGGVQWNYGIASHTCPLFQEGALRADGLLPMIAQSWHEIPQIQMAAKILRCSGPML